MQVKKIRVYGIEESVDASGLPMQIDLKKSKSDPEKRASKLSTCKAGTGHDNFLKGIIVQFDLEYPQYFSPQLQRYNFIDIVSSQSKMHRLTKMRLGEHNCNDWVRFDIMGIVNNLIDDYNKEPSYDNFMAVISNCPLGFELWMRISTNYLQLKTIYNQRKNHKLKDDWGVFCAMIEKLPKSYYITGEK